MSTDMSGAIGRNVQLLGLNSVPVLGLFAGGWSTGTALALYWIESVRAIPFVSVRILLHRRLTRKAGHWGVETETRTSLGGQATVRRGTTTHLVAFLFVMVPFVAAHGVFLAFLLFFILPREGGPGTAVTLADLGRGSAAVAGFMAIGLVVDLVGLSRRPFRWIERLSQRTQGRVLVVHLTILLGMVALAATSAPIALFAVFGGLKTLIDLGGACPERDSPEPPAWAHRLDRLIPSTRGETFVAYWRRTEAEERSRRAANERAVGR